MSEKIPITSNADDKEVVVTETKVDVRKEGIYVNIEATPELDSVNPSQSFGIGFFEKFSD